MRNMRTPVLVLILFSSLGFTLPVVGQSRGLYERLGGEESITAITEEWVSKLFADERLNKKFAKTSVPGFKSMLVAQICAATGGPCKYTGRSMKEAHQNMRVTEGEFKAFIEDLLSALDRFRVPEKEKGDLLQVLGAMHDDIVEVKSSETGTPLPPGFKPRRCKCSDCPKIPCKRCCPPQ